MAEPLKPTSRISLKPTAVRGTERKMPSKIPNCGFATATLEEGNVIVLRLPLISEAKRKQSASGKSILYANTYGARVVRHLVDGELVPVEVDGMQLRIIASAFLPLPKEAAKSK
jgi:hypothetical protein